MLALVKEMLAVCSTCWRLTSNSCTHRYSAEYCFKQYRRVSIKCTRQNYELWNIDTSLTGFDPGDKGLMTLQKFR
jgi:hypothetical protein